MGSAYAEKYVFAGTTYGIEDYEKPGDHFFPNHKHKRFRLWRGGGGFGQADTIQQARAMLFNYADKTLSDEADKIYTRLQKIDGARAEIAKRQSNPKAALKRAKAAA